MTTLAEIINDPNYVNANAATKKAIFDKYSATDTNYTGANEATQKAIRARFGVDTVEPAKAPEVAETQPAPKVEQTFGQKVASADKKIQDVTGEIGRQLGLTGRALVEGNPVVALGDTLAAPIRWAGNAIRPGTFPTTGGEAMADVMGLPKPANKQEAIVQAYSQALASSAGAPALEKAIPYVAEWARPAVKWLSEKPNVQVQSALGATSGALLANEAGLGPNAQLIAALAGGIAGPGIDRAIRIGAEPFRGIGTTVGAAFGHEPSVRRLATDAVERGVGESKGRVRTAMNNVTEFVPGVKPTVAEAVTEANMKSPDQFGGWLVRLQKDLSGSRGVEDVLPSRAKEQRLAIKAEQRAINADTWPVARQILDRVNDGGGVSSSRILGRIDTLIEDAQNRGITLVTRMLKHTRDKVENLSRDNGTIDADSIYSVRKELGNDLKGFQKETNNWDKTRAMGLERYIQKAIDDSIEEAGGIGWKENYLAPQAARRAAIGQQIARAKETARIAREVKPTAGTSVAPGEVPKVPTLLNRPMMFLNYGLKLVSKSANDPVVKELTNLLTDPKKFAEVLSRPDRDPLKIRAVEAIKRGEMAAALAARDMEQ